MRQDASHAFARNAVQTDFERIPALAIEAARLDVMDYVACALAGSNGAGIAEVVALAKELNSKNEATLFVDGGKVGLLEACLANGAMAHAQDYDSTHEGARLHSGVTTITAAIGVAESLGGVSGRDLLTAIVLGTDVICRLGLAYAAPPAGFMWTMVYGYLGSAVAAGKLLQLNEQQMVSAIGLAYAQAAGTQQGNVDGTLDKRMMVGFAARGGVLAALLARKGISGATNSIEGMRGFYSTYNQGRYDPVPLTEDLGKRFEGVNLSFKAYPTCRFNHGHIDAALALAAEHNIRPEEIEGVIAHVERDEHSQFEPLEIKRNPRTVVDAQFSMPYTVALALVKRRVVIDDFTLDAIKDPVVIALANKVSPKVDPSLLAHVPPASVLEVRTSRGTFSKRVEYPYGHPLNPMSPEVMTSKLKDCAAHAARPFSSAEIASLLECIGKLEVIGDVRALVECLRPV